MENNYNNEEFVETVIAAMKRKFGEHHRPSEDMWNDLRNTISHIAMMADGALEANYYLNKLAAGVGKTTAIEESVKAMLAMKHFDGVGILISVPVLEAIETMVKDMGLRKEDAGVYTSDPDVNALGSGDNNNARVLFTTQQMVERRLSKGKDFADLEEFHYRGKPRQVKLWDEAMIPWEEYTINHFGLSLIGGKLGRYNQDLANRLLTLSGDLQKWQGGTTLQFPDLEGEFRVKYEDLTKDLKSLDEREKKTAETIWKLSGKLVTVRKDGKNNTCLDWKPTIPDDFLPVIVFDASGDVRTIYRNMEKSGYKIVPITKAEKRYDNLTICVWNTGSGKDTWRDKAKAAKLLAGIASEVDREPDRPTLIVSHKAGDEDKEQGKDKRPDLSKSLVLKSGTKQPLFLTYGHHKQTNEYKDIDKMILASVYHLPEHVYAVRARASLNRKSDEDLDLSELADVGEGEVRDALLQTLNRGNMRKCIGDLCAPMVVYIIGSDRGSVQLTILLEETFPGAKIEKWDPIPKALIGKVKDALDYLASRISGLQVLFPGDKIAVANIRKAIGVENKQQFSTSILNHDDFIAGYKILGFVLVKEGREKFLQYQPF